MPWFPERRGSVHSLEGANEDLQKIRTERSLHPEEAAVMNEVRVFFFTNHNTHVSRDR